MRIYLLNDRDFEEFYSLLESIEDKLRVQYKDDATLQGRPIADAISKYRYHLIGWRNRMTSGNTVSSSEKVGGRLV